LVTKRAIYLSSPFTKKFSTFEYGPARIRIGYTKFRAENLTIEFETAPTLAPNQIAMAENPIILSDEDDDDPVTPILPLAKRLRAARAKLGLDPAPTIFLIDDDPSPFKPTLNSLCNSGFVPETPMSGVAAAKCTVDLSSPETRVPDNGDAGAMLLDETELGCSGSGKRREYVPETPMTGVAAVQCTVDLSSPERVPDYGDGVAISLEKERFDPVGCSGSGKRLEDVPETPMTGVAAVQWTVDLSSPERVPDYDGVAIRLEKERFNPVGCSGSGKRREDVPETPMTGVAPVQCTVDLSSPDYGDGVSMRLEKERFDPVGCSGSGNWRENETVEIVDDDEDNEVEWRSRFSTSVDSLGGPNLSQMSGTNSFSFEDDQLYDNHEKENFSLEQMHGNAKQKSKSNSNSEENSSQTEKAIGKTRMTKEERTRIMEEKKRKKEAKKLQKAALKAQEAEVKKMEREKLKWAKGKLALKSIVAQLDAKVLEHGSIGGYLLTRFYEKGLTYNIGSHPIERSILWSMTVPEHLAQLPLQENNVRYVLFIYEGEEFCNLITSGSLIGHISKVRSQYPSYTICYLTNKLMAYISKREKEQYNNPGSAYSWRRPPIEEMLAKLTTHYDKVYYRHCRDEAEVGDHVVGLTSSLASCQYRKKLTRLSVNANGSTIPKNFIDKDLVKKSPWLKALIAIPKVQPRFAVAIWKKYPSMKSLLRVYMDPSKSVHEKEFMLANLPVEGIVGSERRVGEVTSKRVYRILMAESGTIRTEDVENGADFFER
ncbi:Crossover junction endonuclease EME1B, partial [Linum grandiflorum]